MKRFTALFALFAIVSLSACSSTSWISREEQAWKSYQKRHGLQQGDPLSPDDWDAIVRCARLYANNATPTVAEIQKTAEWIALYHRWGTFRERLQLVEEGISTSDKMFLAELAVAISSRLTTDPLYAHAADQPVRRAALTEFASD
jgi:hypothetical protein